MKHTSGLPFAFSSDDVEIISKKTLFSGFFKINEYRFRHRLFEGGWSGNPPRGLRTGQCRSDFAV